MKSDILPSACDHWSPLDAREYFRYLATFVCVLAGLLCPIVSGADSGNSLPQGSPASLCQEAGVFPGAYRLSKAKRGYSLRETGKTKASRLPVQRAWLEPLGVQEEEEYAIVSSLNWSKSVTMFPIEKNGAMGLHLSSYEIQKQGSAQVAAGRDVFLVRERDGKLHPGLMDLGLTQVRMRHEGRWFARSHRFAKADIDRDGLTDLGVIKEEIPVRLDSEGIQEIGDPVVQQSPVQWYTYQPSSHTWLHNPERDGQQATDGCPEMLPLIDMAMTPVEFVKKLYEK